MAEVKWIKIVTGIFDDEKIQLIEQMPDCDTILVVWFKLLCLAGKTNNHGIIMLSEKIPYTDEMLSTIFRRPLNTVRLALKTFETYGMIEIVDGVVTISNWEKHQNADGLDKIREQTRLRVAKYKEKQKMLTGNVSGNVTVTQGNATEEDRERDIEEDKNKGNIVPDKPAHAIPEKATPEEYHEAQAKTEKKKFHPPTIGEVTDYCNERKSQGHKNNVDPERFVDFYAANGWVQGKDKPIKDWKACVRTWERGDCSARQTSNNAGNNGARAGKCEEEVPKYGHVV